MMEKKIRTTIYFRVFLSLGLLVLGSGLHEGFLERALSPIMSGG